MSEPDQILSIAETFSAYPAGRTAADGPDNGKRFREEILCPELKRAIAESRQLIVTLDGLKVCGSSFLEEAFGGLVRTGYRADSMRSLKIITTKAHLERYRRSIGGHIRNALLESDK